MGTTQRTVLIIVAVTVSFSAARSDAPSPSAPQRSKPPQDLENLVNGLVGSWSITEDDGTGNIAKGEEIWRHEPGGMPLIEEYHSKTSAGKDAYDYAAVWWDAKAQHYLGIWCADFNSEGCTPFTVRKGEGAKIEMTGEFWNGGKKFVWREVFHLTTPTSFTQILEQAPAGAELRVSVTIHATKVTK